MYINCNKTVIQAIKAPFLGNGAFIIYFFIVF